MDIKTLGVVHSVYKNRVQAPRQGGTIAEIEVSEKHEEGLDATEGTKIIDIKPYIPRIDLKHKANSG